MLLQQREKKAFSSPKHPYIFLLFCCISWVLFLGSCLYRDLPQPQRKLSTIPFQSNLQPYRDWNLLRRRKNSARIFELILYESVHRALCRPCIRQCNNPCQWYCAKDSRTFLHRNISKGNSRLQVPSALVPTQKLNLEP